MQKIKKRILFLYGAGATVDWDGPKTTQMTECIIKDDRFITNNNKTWGSFIYDLLLEYYEEKEKINFETIIDFVETLLMYYDLKTRTGAENLTTKSYLPALFKENNEIKKLFSIKAINTLHSYEEDIVVNDVNKKALLYHVYHNFLIIIKGQIFYDKIDSFKDKKFSKLNESYINFINYICEKYIKRAYTLNYDNLFPCICKGLTNFFNGFSSKLYKNIYCENYSNTYDYDLEGILYSKKNENTFFNLHGCIYWRKNHYGNGFLSYDNNNAENSYFAGSITSGANVLEGERNSGEYIIDSPIITGFKKIQKLITEPFNSFQTSFKLDCMESDMIFAIGYSFSDQYINSLLKTSLQYKSKIIISVNYIENADKNEPSLFLTNPLIQKVKVLFFDNNIEHVDKGDYLVFKQNDEVKMYLFYKSFKDFLFMWEDLKHKLKI